MIEFSRLMDSLTVICLAAGKGTRMGGGEPKVLRKIGGKPIIMWTLELIRDLGLEGNSIFVVGHGSEEVINKVHELGFSPKFVNQEQLLGTGHAVKTAIEESSIDTKDVLVLFGDDSGLYRPESIRKFVDDYKKSGRVGMVLAKKVNEVTSIGAIIVDGSMNVIGVQTKADLELGQFGEHYVMCGALCFDLAWLRSNINKITPNVNTGEYPLPQLIKIAFEQENPLGLHDLNNFDEWSSINTEVELNEADKLRRSLNA